MRQHVIIPVGTQPRVAFQTFFPFSGLITMKTLDQDCQNSCQYSIQNMQDPFIIKRESVTQNIRSYRVFTYLLESLSTARNKGSTPDPDV